MFRVVRVVFVRAGEEYQVRDGPRDELSVVDGECVSVHARGCIHACMHVRFSFGGLQDRVGW